MASELCPQGGHYRGDITMKQAKLTKFNGTTTGKSPNWKQRVATEDSSFNLVGSSTVQQQVACSCSWNIRLMKGLFPKRLELTKLSTFYEHFSHLNLKVCLYGWNLGCLSFVRINRLWWPLNNGKEFETSKPTERNSTHHLRFDFP